MFITRERVLCGCMLWRHRKSFRSTVRKIEQLLCRSANLSFRPVFVYCRIKKPCETRNQPAGFGLTSDAGFEKRNTEAHRRIKRRIRKVRKEHFSIYLFFRKPGRAPLHNHRIIIRHFSVQDRVQDCVLAQSVFISVCMGRRGSSMHQRIPMKIAQ